MPRIYVDNLGSGGVVQDVPPHRLPMPVWSEVINGGFDLRGAVRFPSHRAVLSASSIANMDQLCWLFLCPTQTDPTWVYASIAAQKRLGAVYKSGGVWTHTDITRAAGVYTNEISQRWNGCIFQGIGIFNNVNDVPQYWTFNPAAPCVDLSNWATNPEGADARFYSIRAYRNFLVGLRLRDYNGGSPLEYPFRLRWSDAAPPGQLPASWDTADPENLSGEQDLAETPDYIVDGLTLNDVFIVYKEKSTWGMQLIGGQNVMRFWKILPDSGLLWRDCVAAFPGGHFVVTQDDIIVHNGGIGSEQSVVDNRCRRYVFNNLNRSAYYHCYTLLHPAQKQVWFCYPTGNSEFASMALVWNWVDNSIGFKEIPNAPFGANGPVPELSSTDTWG